jgi:putative PIN family toxin of toxin-antitoxin system
LRVYLDTNVVVSAVATRGLCADVLQAIVAEHDLVVGEAMLSELRRILAQKLGLPKEIVEETEGFLRRQGTVVEAKTTQPIKGLDAADATVVAEAVAGAADLLVTGDHGLLGARGLPINTIAPRELWDRLRRAT